MKTIIIGAGITGLSCGKYLENDYMILEKASQYGGKCRSIRGELFNWDYAGHFFHFKSVEMASMFKELLGEENYLLKEKKTKIFYKNHWIDFPFQNHIDQLPISDYQICLEGFNQRKSLKTYDNFQSFLYGEFGNGITEAFLKPYNEKLYHCTLDQLDAHAMGRFFPKLTTLEPITYNQSFYYPKAGTFAFVEAFCKKYNIESHIRLNETVVGIELKEKKVKTTKGCYSYDVLINTMPLSDFLDCMDLPYDLSANKVLVLNLGFDKSSSIKDVHWIYVPDPLINFYRVGFYNNILDENSMNLYVEISYNREEGICVDDTLQKTLMHLKAMGIVDEHQLLEYSHVIMNPGYVHITKSLEKKRQEIVQMLKAHDVYTIGRYGKWVYNAIEDNMLDAKKLIEKLKQHE